ncbi:MAG: hypothetical protein ACF8R7_14395 [Phycisphaerales bacterium JB039]
MAGCAAPEGAVGEEPWPPRLRPAEQRIGVAPTLAERREQALRRSGETVLRDSPYH